jgi:hypothetical protein
MDAVVFQKEWARMCRSYDDCKDCPLRLNGCSDGLGASVDIAKKRSEIVEKWSKEHPFKTNGMRFLDDNREHIRTYHRWENDCKPYIEVHIEADWWDAEYKEER